MGQFNLDSVKVENLKKEIDAEIVLINKILAEVSTELETMPFENDLLGKTIIDAGRTFKSAAEEVKKDLEEASEKSAKTIKAIIKGFEAAKEAFENTFKNNGGSK